MHPSKIRPISHSASPSLAFAAQRRDAAQCYNYSADATVGKRRYASRVFSHTGRGRTRPESPGSGSWLHGLGRIAVTETIRPAGERPLPFLGAPSEQPPIERGRECRLQRPLRPVLRAEILRGRPSSFKLRPVERRSHCQAVSAGLLPGPGYALDAFSSDR